MSAQQKQIISMNYWKEIHKEVADVLQDLRGIVLLTHNSVDFSDILDFVNKTRPNHQLNVLYLSVTRSYEFMKNELSKRPLDKKNVYFIDCVSGLTMDADKKFDDCLFLNPPRNLDEIKDIVNQGLDNFNLKFPDIVVMDSLSHFINFAHPSEKEIEEIYGFLRTLRGSTVNILRDTFFLLYDSKVNVLQKLPKMSTDVIMKLEIVKM